MLSWSGCILWDNESFFCEPFVVSTAAVSGGVTGQVQHGPASSPQRMLVSGGLARANQEDGNNR